MGNLCGKQSQDNFAGPGRTLGSAPAPSHNARASIPASQKPAAAKTSPGAGQKLGGGAPGVTDARTAAGRAAEVGFHRRLFWTDIMMIDLGIGTSKQIRWHW
jgi:hypothetical protein